MAVRRIRIIGTPETRQADRIDIATDPEESVEFPHVQRRPDDSPFLNLFLRRINAIGKWTWAGWISRPPVRRIVSDISPIASQTRRAKARGSPGVRGRDIPAGFHPIRLVGRSVRVKHLECEGDGGDGADEKERPADGLALALGQAVRQEEA
jgi:hypothetical protein